MDRVTVKLWRIGWTMGVWHEAGVSDVGCRLVQLGMGRCRWDGSMARVGAGGEGSQERMFCDRVAKRFE